MNVPSAACGVRTISRELYSGAYGKSGRPLRARPGEKPGELRAADAAFVSRARGARLPGPGFGDSRRAALHVEGNLRALPPPGLVAREARHRRRRHGRRDAAEYPGDGRGAFRRCDVRGGAQYLEYAPGRRGDRVHARAWRSEAPAD